MAERMLVNQIHNKLLPGFILGLGVFVALGLYADFTAIYRLLWTFDWTLVPAILVLTAANYGLRFVKWHYYLHQIGIEGVPVWDNLRIFLGGFGLSLTPGKSGELVKSVWLRNRTGVHPAKTAPMILAERLSDGIAMVLLALLGGALYPPYRPAVAVVGSLLVAVVIAIQTRRLANLVLRIGERTPLVSRFTHHLQLLYESAQELLNGRNLAVAVGLGCVAWGIEGIAFYLILVGLGLSPSPSLVLLAISVLSLALIAGGVSGMPGGLGVTEGGLTGLLLFTAAAPEGVAATATLLVRFCVLWLGVITGVIVILIWRRFLFSSHPAEVPTLAVE